MLFLCGVEDVRATLKLYKELADWQCLVKLEVDVYSKWVTV